MVVPTNGGSVGSGTTPPGRVRKRTMAVLASALITLPVALSADVAGGWVNVANRGPLGDPRPAAANQYTAAPWGLGATGMVPHDSVLSPDLVHDAGNPSALLTGAGPQANLPRGPLGIPGVVLDAYLHAQSVLAAQQPNCRLPWWLLAGIGKIESGQAENGEVDVNGNTLRPILGPELNGANGTAAIRSSDGGRWTGDAVWERAVGPMQFLPSTWRQYGGAGNPNNVYDAAIAAGRYLCAGGRNLADPAQRAQAVFSYNHSDSYVRIVLIWADAYAAGVTPLPETTVPPGAGPIVVTPGAPLAGPPVAAGPVVPGTSAPASTPGSTSNAPGSTLGGPTTTTGGSTTTTTGGSTTTTTTTQPPSSTPPTTTTTTAPSCPSSTPPSATPTPTPTPSPTPAPGCPTPTPTTTPTPTH